MPVRRTAPAAGRACFGYMGLSVLSFASRLARNLRYSYLFLPGVMALGFAGLAVGLTQIDKTGGATGVLGVFPAGPPGARAVLTTIAAAVATVAGVSFSITIVSLQLVSQQFTPRALRGFLADRLNQAIAGVFIGVFLFCLVALRTVAEGERGFVPGLTMTVAVGLAVLALLLLLVFIHHMGHSIQVSNISRKITDGTLAAAESLHPGAYGDAEAEEPDAVVARWARERTPVEVAAATPGFVQSFDDLPRAVGSRARVELLVAPGDFVTERDVLARVWAAEDADACAAGLRRSIAIAPERDLAQDVGFGLRQLADIAVKALSPGVNDPTTATTCIGYLRAVLERLAATPWPEPVRRLPDEVELVLPRADFEDHLEVLVQVGRYATADARVVHALLDTALAVAESARRDGQRAHALAAGRAGLRIARRALDDGGLDAEEREEIGRLAAELAQPA